MIKSTAPTRIDLAGGTLDIWPLYLQFGNPPTLNAAINLYATVELTPRSDRKVFVKSKDLPCQARFNSIASLPERSPLGPHFKNPEILSTEKRLEYSYIKRSTTWFWNWWVVSFEYSFTWCAQYIYKKRSR